MLSWCRLRFKNSKCSFMIIDNLYTSHCWTRVSSKETVQAVVNVKFGPPILHTAPDTARGATSCLSSRLLSISLMLSSHACFLPLTLLAPAIYPIKSNCGKLYLWCLMTCHKRFMVSRRPRFFPMCHRTSSLVTLSPFSWRALNGTRLPYPKKPFPYRPGVEGSRGFFHYDAPGC